MLRNALTAAGVAKSAANFQYFVTGLHIILGEFGSQLHRVSYKCTAILSLVTGHQTNSIPFTIPYYDEYFNFTQLRQNF
jgi:hypothetical protein